MFSAGQGTRMNNSISASRASLLNSLGCVPPSVAPVAGFDASATVICKEQSVSFSDLSVNNPASWSWSFPGGTPSASTSQNPVITYNSVGTYAVSLTVTNSAGSDSETITGFITVNGLPQVTVSATGSSHVVCAGSSLVLTANSISPNLSYQWTKYGVNIPGATNASYPATATGNYKVLVTKPNGCSKLSANYRVDKVPLPVVQIAPQGPTTFCPGGSVILSATQNSSWDYVWKKFSNTVPGANGHQLTASTSGDYKVVVTDTNGCVKSSAKVVVDANCKISADNGIITVFPNPVSEILNLNLNMPVATTTPVLLYDAIGRLVHSTFIYSGESIVSINVAQLPKGVYLVLLSLPDGNLTTRIIRE
jgi:PKD repeat protein